MKLFKLAPINTGPDSDWDVWYDKMFGIVVRAENEQDARIIAAAACGVEKPELWRDATKTSCVVVTLKGEPAVILREVLNGV